MGSTEEWLDYILNTDCASKGNPGQADGGGTISDHRGAMLSAFMEIMAIAHHQKQALLGGLKLAQTMAARYFEVMVDSQLVEGWLNKELPDHHPHFCLILECKKLMMLEGQTVQVQHCYREANHAADLLANQGALSPSKRVVISSPPPP